MGIEGKLLKIQLLEKALETREEWGGGKGRELTDEWRTIEAK